MPKERIWEKMFEQPIVKQEWNNIVVYDENRLWEIVVTRWNDIVFSPLYENFIIDIVLDIDNKLQQTIFNDGRFVEWIEQIQYLL